jgi:hypothetical protein
MIIRQCPVKHRYFSNFLGCMSLFKCRLVEYILHMRVNAKYLHHEDILVMSTFSTQKNIQLHTGYKAEWCLNQTNFKIESSSEVTV